MARILLLITGIALIVGGFIAAFNPFAATLAAEQIAGWLFLLGGITQIFAIFSVSSWGARIWAALLAAACIWLGITLLYHPLAGIMALTIMAAIMFLTSGIAKLFLSFAALRGTNYFWATLISGAVSVVLAVMVFGNILQAASVLLGIMLAIELISSGVTLIVVAGYLKNLPEDGQEA